jgi:hypothetical protein
MQEQAPRLADAERSPAETSEPVLVPISSGSLSAATPAADVTSANASVSVTAVDPSTEPARSANTGWLVGALVLASGLALTQLIRGRTR